MRPWTAGRGACAPAIVVAPMCVDPAIVPVRACVEGLAVSRRSAAPAPRTAGMGPRASLNCVIGPAGPTRIQLWIDGAKGDVEGKNRPIVGVAVAWTLDKASTLDGEEVRFLMRKRFHKEPLTGQRF